ncbi:MAG: ferritin [Saprospiraceae bacterium]|nr:ferritin [Saprospiraceae bacterium]
MVSENLTSALNKQIEMEGYASFLYLSMSCWCEHKGLKGCAAFLRRQSEEENMHMLKIIDYMLDVDAIPVIPQVNQPPVRFDSIVSLMHSVYEHEKKVTRSIHQLVDLCTKEDNSDTFNFLQWYVIEQREEEALMRSILDKIKLIGDGPQSLYYIDKEVETINAQQVAKATTN